MKAVDSGNGLALNQMVSKVKWMQKRTKWWTISVKVSEKKEKERQRMKKKKRRERDS